MQNPNTEILGTLKSRPEIALKSLYDTYYSFVCNVVYKMVGDANTAKDIAQEVFVEIWKRRDSLDISSTLQGYLRRMAVNKTLNYIRAKKMSFQDEEVLIHVPNNENSSQKIMEANDLQVVINKAIESLPEKCRIVFALSRFEEKSYREISESLGISKKTVENQISKALKIMRKAVIEYQEENN